MFSVDSGDVGGSGNFYFGADGEIISFPDTSEGHFFGEEHFLFNDNPASRSILDGLLGKCNTLSEAVGLFEISSIPVSLFVGNSLARQNFRRSHSLRGQSS